MTIKEKILNSVELTLEEVMEIVWGDAEELEIVEEVRRDELKWHEVTDVVFKVEERFFMVFYYRGLGYHGENNYEEQIAVEVKPVQVLRTEWVEKE